MCSAAVPAASCCGVSPQVLGVDGTGIGTGTVPELAAGDGCATLGVVLHASCEEFLLLFNLCGHAISKVVRGKGESSNLKCGRKMKLGNSMLSHYRSVVVRLRPCTVPLALASRRRSWSIKQGLAPGRCQNSQPGTAALRLRISCAEGRNAGNGYNT